MLKVTHIIISILMYHMCLMSAFLQENLCGINMKCEKGHILQVYPSPALYMHSTIKINPCLFRLIDHLDIFLFIVIFLLNILQRVLWYILCYIFRIPNNFMNLKILTYLITRHLLFPYTSRLRIMHLPFNLHIAPALNQNRILDSK